MEVSVTDNTTILLLIMILIIIRIQILLILIIQILLILIILIIILINWNESTQSTDLYEAANFLYNISICFYMFSLDPRIADGGGTLWFQLVNQVTWNEIWVVSLYWRLFHFKTSRSFPRMLWFTPVCVASWCSLALTVGCFTIQASSSLVHYRHFLKISLNSVHNFELFWRKTNVTVCLRFRWDKNEIWLSK